jgi:hypothetical protein
MGVTKGGDELRRATGPPGMRQNPVGEPAATAALNSETSRTPRRHEL